MINNLSFRKHIEALEKINYITDSAEADHELEDAIDLSHGVNPFGYSKLISEEKQDFQDLDYSHYPSEPYYCLRKMLAEHWRNEVEIDDSNIRLEAGAVPILNNINKVFIDRGSKVYGYSPQFSHYIDNINTFGGAYEYCMLDINDNYRFHYEKMLENMRTEHSLVYIDNPNNPTGQILPIAELELILEEAARLGICVIIDEAYGDFMNRDNSAISLVNKYDNLFVVRTFSKGFGLAGLRIGYVCCSNQLMNYYDKVGNPFGVNCYAERILPIALRDKEFIASSVARTKRIKNDFMKVFSKVQVCETDPGVPLMFLRHPDENIDLYEEFINENVLTIKGTKFMGTGKNFVRVRIPPEVTERLRTVIRKIENK